MAFWTYILACADGRYYTGHTDNFERRMAEHQNGHIQGFTRSRLPVKLMWPQNFATRYEALDAELKIKKWSKAKKEALFNGDWDALSFYSKPPSERVHGSILSMGVSTSLDTNGVGAKSNIVSAR
jgi:putative endonuclease